MKCKGKPLHYFSKYEHVSSLVWKSNIFANCIPDFKTWHNCQSKIIIETSLSNVNTNIYLICFQNYNIFIKINYVTWLYKNNMVSKIKMFPLIFVTHLMLLYIHKTGNCLINII